MAKFGGSGTGRQFCCCWKNILKVFEKILAEYLKTIWNTGRQFYCCCGGEKISFFKFFILVFNSTAAAVKYHQKYSKHATAPWFEGVDDGHGWSIWYVEKNYRIKAKTCVRMMKQVKPIWNSPFTARAQIRY